MGVSGLGFRALCGCGYRRFGVGLEVGLYVGGVIGYLV